MPCSLTLLKIFGGKPEDATLFSSVLIPEFIYLLCCIPLTKAVDTILHLVVSYQPYLR